MTNITLSKFVKATGLDIYTIKAYLNKKGLSYMAKDELAYEHLKMLKRRYAQNIANTKRRSYE